jgi:hypothetical protein
LARSFLSNTPSPLTSDAGTKSLHKGNGRTARYLINARVGSA